MRLGGSLASWPTCASRPQHYLSSLQQRLKASAIVRQPRPLVYRKVLESYGACFGPDAVSARLFHRDHLEQGDIVADFCKHYLAEFEIDPAELRPGDKTNETLSAESMDILARYRQAFHAERNGVSTRDTVKLCAALAEADSRHGAARPRLRPGVAETIDYASHDCLWVRDRFGVVFPDLDYDRLAATAPAAAPDPERTFALEELVVIDRELQAQILDSLAQSPWADDAARKAWLDGLLRPPSKRARPPCDQGDRTAFGGRQARASGRERPRLRRLAAATAGLRRPKKNKKPPPPFQVVAFRHRPPCLRDRVPH